MRGFSMIDNMTGKTAVIVGAANRTGIGHAFSRGLVRRGVNVVVADVSDTQAVVSDLNSGEARVLGVECDVADQAAVERLKNTVNEDFGGCDILIHCASPLLANDLHEMPFDEWRKGAFR